MLSGLNTQELKRIGWRSHEIHDGGILQRSKEVGNILQRRDALHMSIQERSQVSARTSAISKHKQLKDAENEHTNTINIPC